MIFMFFAAGIAVIFFVSSMVALHWWQSFGPAVSRARKDRKFGGACHGRGSIFGLMGLLLALTISGALQRFDDRRQLVLQEATAVTRPMTA